MEQPEIPGLFLAQAPQATGGENLTAPCLPQDTMAVESAIIFGT